MYHSIELTTTILSIKNSISRPPLRRGLPRKQIHVFDSTGDLERTIPLTEAARQSRFCGVTT